MTLEELKEQLYKLSIEFVKDNNSMIGEYTYESLINDLHMSAQRRFIVGNLQLFEANNITIDNKEYIEAVFQFSPYYLNREPEMLYAGMKDLKWKLILENEKNKTADTHNKTIENLSRAYIEVSNYEQLQQIELNEFIGSLI
jgi:hypothetical protein